MNIVYFAELFEWTLKCFELNAFYIFSQITEGTKDLNV